MTLSPDWPSVAQVIEGLYPQSGGLPVDGAISVDPAAIAAFLKLTGPVNVDGLDFPLTAKNAAPFLFRDQYLNEDLQSRVDVLGNTVDAVIDRIQNGNLPGAARIGKVLGPMVKQGRLKLQTVDPAGETFLTRIHAGGELPTVRGDFAGLVTQNASGNKIELFLDRSLTYESVVDPKTGTVKAVATITLRNTAPTSGVPDYVITGSGPDPTPPGHYRGLVSFYTPLDLQQATLDGQPVPSDTTVEQELGRNVITRYVDIDSGGQATLRLELAGPVRMPVVADGRRYRLTLWHQPTIEPDHLTVKVSGGPGTDLEDPRGLDGDGAAVGLVSPAPHRSPGRRHRDGTMNAGGQRTLKLDTEASR